jgi:hypothetical protein
MKGTGKFFPGTALHFRTSPRGALSEPGVRPY